MPSINLKKEMLSRFEEEIRKEWLITNGLGGYASSTVLGINTRKYHGMLVAALNPPGNRRVLLTKLDEDLHVGSEIYRLGTNEFQEGFFPRGYSFLTEFSASPFPSYVYTVGKVVVQKTAFMLYTRNAIVTLYKIANNNNFDIKIQVFPIVNERHFHSTTDKSKGQVEFVQKQDDSSVQVTSKTGGPVLMMNVTEGRYSAGGKWVEHVYLREEAHRGESCFDDCFQPGHFETKIEAGNRSDFGVVAAADVDKSRATNALAQLPLTTDNVRALYEKEKKRYENLLVSFYGKCTSASADSWLDWLVLAADSFLVQRADGRRKAVIAGYHWFESWGRDTFISLPGLLLVPGRFEHAKEVLLTFKGYCKKGLIPNFLPEQNGGPSYNTVDATLWFVNAILQYLKYTGDFKFVREQLWETIKEIIENHVKGTGFNIRVDTDGLLLHGSRLTWMDALVNNEPATPREGKAVEIQALWYNLLKTGQLLGNNFGETKEADAYGRLAEKAKKSFSEKFWNVEKGCLYDVISGSERDGSLRPNQILAVALDFGMLDEARSRKIVDVVRRELMTPFGLRTLSKDDSRYLGVYVGNREGRDRAYHNGPVWPWLMGPFSTAFIKTGSRTESARRNAFDTFLLPLFTVKVSEGGLGTLSELFDGDPPYAPGGCISQAWSVAESLRAYVEDILQIRPEYEKEVMRILV